MITLDIAQQRLYNQHIASTSFPRPAGGAVDAKASLVAVSGATSFEKPAEVVRWLGAVQSQDYGAAKWAVGLRLLGATDNDIEQAFADGAIIRTHVMRPTWHFVSPDDIRWLLALTAPRVNALNAYQCRRFELDDTVFKQGNVVLTKALQGGNQLTRPELAFQLQQAGIATDDGVRLAYLIMRAELDGVVCSGARRGKQFTYALLDERVSPAKTLERDAALAEFALRYFTGHGPATLQDFVWWSGLTVADARAGLAMVTSQLMHEVVDGQAYWFAASTLPPKALSHMAYLLPNFDEYIVGYQDRSAVFDTSHTKNLDARGNILFNHTMILDGQIVGNWKRTLQKGGVMLTPNLFTALDEVEMRAFVASAERYGAFLERPVSIAL